MICADQLCKTFETESVRTHAVRDVSLAIEPGEFVAIMGPSGSGKSTLLNLLGLIDQPSKGSLKFFERETAELSEKDLATIRNRRIGFVFQNFNLIDDLTVRENVELVLKYQGVARSERRERARSALTKMDMLHRESHYPHQLSGGQQQRVAIARATVGRPEFIFADEPTGNLDSENREIVMGLLRDLHQAGTGIVMVTHSDECAAAAQRNLAMADGQLVA